MTLAHESRAALALRRVKVAILQARRLARWGLSPSAWRPPPTASKEAFPHAVYRRVIPIRGDGDTPAALEEGKRINVALAALHFDGRVVAPSTPLSFWRTLGRVSEARGFRHGVELRGGCMLPTVGGGLCLLSNALFQMAVALDWEILERHGHTMDVASSDGLWGLDATVFWPHVDLRIAPRRGSARLEVSAIGDELVVGVRHTIPAAPSVSLYTEGDGIEIAPGGRYRKNRIRRVAYEVGRDDGSGGARVASDELVAINRKKLLTPAGRRRTCLTCDETRCNARPRNLP